MGLIEALARAICEADNQDPNVLVFKDYPAETSHLRHVVRGERFQSGPPQDEWAPLWMAYRPHALAAFEAMKRAISTVEE
jgi:hypothetical protein